MQGSRRTVAPQAVPIAIAVGLVVAVASFAACGGTDFSGRNSASPGVTIAPVPVPTVRNLSLQTVVVRSVARTAAARTARTSISVTLTGLGDGSVASGAFDVAGTGVVDLRSGNALLSLSVPRFDRLGNKGPIEQRIVGGTAYLKAPAAIVKAGGLPASVHWLSVRANAIGGADPAALSQAQVDPAAQLALLAAVSPNVRRVGSEPVRGVPATHYTATIDLSRSASGATAGKATAPRLAALGSVVGPGELQIDAWLDASGQARRVVVTIPMSKTAGTLRAEVVGPRAMMRIQADLFAFGTPVRVSVPPANQTRPYGSLHVPPGTD